MNRLSFLDLKWGAAENRTVVMLSLATTFIKERVRKKYYIYLRVSSPRQQIRIGVKFGIAMYPSSMISKL